MRRVRLLLAFGALLATQSAGAQNWVDAVFPERSYDFQTVARGSKIRHSFRLVNHTNQEIHIASWRTKCGCTEVRVGARDIPPRTQTSIDAVIDTTKFLGFKASGLTLVIDRPNYVEVDLNLTCFIRGDIVLNPGQVEFGNVQRGGNHTATLYLTYAGNIPNWGVNKMVTRSSHISAKLEELGQSYEGQKQYSLNVKLNPSVPNGYFKDEITAWTNDPSSPTIPISVTANVLAAVSVSPSIMNLGAVKAGGVVKKRVLVSSRQTFKLTGVTADRDALTAKPDGDDAKTVHTVEITFTAPKQTGPYNGVFELATDLKDEPPAKLSTFATVVP